MWYYDIVEKNKQKTKNKDKPQEDTKEEETERGSSHEWRAVSSSFDGVMRWITMEADGRRSARRY